MINLRPLLIGLVLLSPATDAFSSDINNFDYVTKEITRTLNCREASTFGNIYGCILGRRETVRVFVERYRRERNRVLNVRFVWEDYHRNVGVPLHAGSRAAKKALIGLAKILAPTKREFILSLLKRGEGVKSRSTIQISVDKGPAAYTREALFQ